MAEYCPHCGAVVYWMANAPAAECPACHQLWREVLAEQERDRLLRAERNRLTYRLAEIDVALGDILTNESDTPAEGGDGSG